MFATRSKDRDGQLVHASGTSITQRLARAAAVHPWRVVVAWGLILLASVVAIGDPDRVGVHLRRQHHQQPRLGEGRAGASPRTSPRLTASTTPSSSTPPSSPAEDPEFQAFVADVRSSIEATGAAQTVRDPYAADGSGISEDGHAAVVTLVLGHDPETGIVDVIDEVVAADADAAFEVDITGTNTLDHDFTELSESDLTNGELKFGLPAAMIVLVLVFGALVAAFLPMSIAILSIIVTVAISSVLGQFTSLSFFIVNMITAMGLALGIDYSLFVLSRYREERQAGRDKIDAIVATGGTSSKAVLFSGSSFVVALLGLLLVPDTILRSLALGAIIVGVVTMAAALTLLPALLSLLGDRVNALRLPIVGRDHPAESPFWTRAVSAVVRRPGTFLAAGLLVLLAAALPVLGLHTGTSGVNSLPDDTYAKAGALALERSFPGTSTTDPAQVVISGDVDLQRRHRSHRTSSRPPSPTTRTSARRSSRSPRTARSRVVSIPLVGDPDHTQARRGLDRLRTDLVPAAFDGTDTTVLVGGTTAENVDYSDVINHWLPIVLAFVLGLSFLLLTLVFRSLVLSATAVVLNLLSVGAAYGLLVLVFQHGVGADLLGFQQVERVEAWVPVFLFSVLFALSMDYHVFLLSRIRERYAQTGDTNQAVVHGIAATGRIITGAALIIVVVFAGFAAGQLVMFQQMGFGVGVALLVDATLIRMVVVPATMALLGRWNWYLPSWLNWLPELHVEGDPESVDTRRSRRRAPRGRRSRSRSAPPSPADRPAGQEHTTNPDDDRRPKELNIMTDSTARHTFRRTWLLWFAGALAFPIAGVAGTAVAGRVDDAGAALVGGTVAGLVLGAGQALASRRRLDPRRWIPATAAGMGAGLLLGAWTVDYGTSLADLALMGALTGLVLGPAQALALPARAAHRWSWAVAMPALWALGWTVTTLGGIHVDEQFTNFGLYGALTFSAVSGLLLHRLLPYQETSPAPAAPAVAPGAVR